MNELDEDTTVTDDIRRAAIERQPVTVIRDDGRQATGTLAQHPTDPDFYKVVTGRRGRPFIFHPADVQAVIFE